MIRKKSKTFKLNWATKRSLTRQKRERELKRKLERQRNDALILLLTHFIDRHNGNPTVGRRGVIMTAPVGARLFHASSLRALLIENEPVIQ